MRNAIPIDDFLLEEVNSIINKFSDKKIGTLTLCKETIKGKTMFTASLKEDSKFKIWADSVDEYHAKKKIVTKLRDYLREKKQKSMFPSFLPEMQGHQAVPAYCC